MPQKPLSVFSAAYWRAAKAEFRNVRVLAFSGLVCAMAIVLESLPIYLLGPSLKIYFSYLVVSLGCMCYGPLVGMLCGAVIDSLGFLLAGYGEPYFPGYLLTAIAVGADLRRGAVPPPPHGGAHFGHAAAHQLRQQRAAGQRVESDALRQGLPLLCGHGACKNTVLLPLEVF